MKTYLPMPDTKEKSPDGSVAISTSARVKPAAETASISEGKEAGQAITPIQCKLTIGSPNDPLEQEADAMADTIMRMQEQPFVQRKCTQCAEEEKLQRKTISPFLQRKETATVNTASEAITAKINAGRGNGNNMDTGTRAFMQGRFGADFGAVKIHTGAEAIQMSRELNAKAFTVGNDIYFNQGQYDPVSAEGRHLLAHELTHTIQQSGQVQRQIQREVHNGHDNYASYAFDDSACTLNYHQHWYFRFNVTLPDTEKQRLMQQAAQQVHDQWTGRFPLLPAQTASQACPCSEGGVAVDVNIAASEGEKTGRGIAVTVQPSVRANVNPVSGGMELEHNSSSSDFAGSTYNTGLQYTVAHEFGHTIDITDEYPGWTGFFVPAVQADETSMMNTGNNVRTRHYQYFGDLISLEIPGCRYNPNGVREPERENPVFRTSTLAGITTAQDGLTFPNPALNFGMNFDRRISNERVMGIFYPQLGAISLLNPVTGADPLIGATGGLRLGQIAHPLVFNLRTGIVFNPENPANTLSIPVNIQAGLRTDHFEFGLQYTPVFNIFNPGQVEHLFGAGLSVPLW